MTAVSSAPRAERRNGFFRRFLAALAGPEIMRRRAAQRRVENLAGSADAPRDDDSATERVPLKQTAPLATDVAAIRDALGDVERAVARLRSLGMVVELRIPTESDEGLPSQG
ncbi:MAG: hypothetical protein HUU22_18390 [Phycisphaerae bacterium]|nr:hypothetical protein [Phycisphaerae bacterium]NUQ47986.1 hypothetical protein [Phycisphaerae bacterium]